MSGPALALFILLSPAESQAAPLEELLEKGEREAVARSLRENRIAGKKRFTADWNQLLQARLADGEGLAALKRRLELLVGVFADELNEPHLRFFLRESLTWGKDQIREKLKADEAHIQAAKLSRQGRADEALRILEELIPKCRELPYTSGLTGSLLLEGEILRDRGEILAAMESLLEAYREAEKVPYRTHMCAALSALGWIHLRQGRHAEAEGAYRRHIDLSREIGDQHGESRARVNLAQVAIETGRHRDASEHLLATLALPGRDPSLEAALHHSLGILHSHERDHLAAFRAYEKALSLAAESDLRRRILVNLGGLWWQQGDAERAREAFETALKLAGEAGNEAEVAAACNNLAAIDASKGDLARARVSFEKALEIQRRLGDLAMVGRTVANLCLLAWEEDRSDEGDALYAEALSILGQSGDRTVEAGLEIERGFRLLARRELAEARRCFREAAWLKLEARDFEGGALASIGLGKVALAEEKSDEASACFREAVEGLMRQREKVTSARYRDIFFNRKELADCFALLAGTILAGARTDGPKPDPGKAEEAFAVAEQAKAQGLLAELLAGGEARRQVPEELRNREAELRARQAELREKLAVARGAKFELLASEFDRNEREYLGLQERIWAQFPRIRPATLGRPANVRDRLPEGTVLLEYLIGQDRSFLFAVSKEALEAFALPGESEIRGCVEELLRRCRDPLASVKAESDEAAQLLLGPALSAIRKAARLLVVADGVLHGLPFGVLRVGGRYLAEACPIAYLPSASFALSAAGRGESRKEAFVFGDPVYRREEVLDPRLGWGKVELARLEASRAEAEDVAKILGARLFLGEDASEAKLKAVLPQARHLHLALHGLLHPERPELSCLILGRGEGDDGVLELRELAGTSSELVVISACESGLGELSRTEGFLGFGRSFLAAGARTLVLSSWQVSDRCASELMPALWKAFSERGDAAAALREAQLSFLARARAGQIAVSGGQAVRGPFERVPKVISAEHPFFWAGFVVITREVEP